MTPDLKQTTETVVANGPIAIEREVYRISLTPPGAKEAVKDSTKYLIHWHKSGDAWLKVEAIWNNDLPLMRMGPPAKP